MKIANTLLSNNQLSKKSNDILQYVATDNGKESAIVLCYWCERTFGYRYKQWTYKGNYVWNFRTQEQAVLFTLVWG